VGVATAFPCQSRFFFATFPERFTSRPRQTTKPFRKDLKNAAKVILNDGRYADCVGEIPDFFDFDGIDKANYTTQQQTATANCSSYSVTGS